MRVGVDLDGVCYNFGAALRTYLHWLGYHETPMPEPARWNFYEDWGLSEATFKHYVKNGIRAGHIFAVGDPFPGTRDTLEAIQQAGHTIHIVTDRLGFGAPNIAASNTLRWLTDHQLPYDSITFSADKTVADVNVFIDDKPENVTDLAHAGVPAYLLTRPWNQAFDWDMRVTSMPDFAEVIL